MVVYEVNVREFNEDFEGVITQLDYIQSLGVNVLSSCRSRTSRK